MARIALQQGPVSRKAGRADAAREFTCNFQAVMNFDFAARLEHANFPFQFTDNGDSLFIKLGKRIDLYLGSNPETRIRSKRKSPPCSKRP